jgi:hypothetical protein
VALLVDTSAWVEFLRSTGSPVSDRVRGLADTRDFAITDVIVAELLVGARTAKAARSLRALASTGRFYPVRPLFDYETAAQIGLTCRSAGTPVALSDCLIAAVALNSDLELLAADRDFEVIAELVPLQLDSI